MKKLMITLAAVAMGVAANAATVDWAVKRDVTDDTKSVLAYAFIGTDRTAVENLLKSYASTTAFAANFDGDVTSNFGYNSNGTGSSKGAVSGAIAGDSIADKTAYDVFLVVFDANTLAGATKYEISDNFSTAGYSYTAQTQATKVQAQGAAGDFGNAWNDIGTAVPEPTSGLLLLLGVAGLALKRKRA